MRRRHLTVEVRSSMLLTFRSVWKIFAPGVVEGEAPLAGLRSEPNASGRLSGT